MSEAKQYQKRRQDLLRQIGEDDIVILPTAAHKRRNSDVFYPYRCDSDFYYLTGFAEPEAVAVLCPGREKGEYIVFCRERDPERELWDGKRLGLGGAVEHLLADDAFPIADIAQILPGLMENREKIYTLVGRYPEFDASILSWINKIKRQSGAAGNAPHELVDLSHILHEHRLIKLRDEVQIIRKSAKISAAAHVRAMQSCRPEMYEYQVQAELEYVLANAGCANTAYPSIVAGGKNACILHYTENDARLNDGELLLIDAGGELDCYAADISRTFPVNGRFSPQQRVLYDIVLDAQKAALSRCTIEHNWNDIHQAAVEVIAQGLLDEKILSGNLQQVLEEKLYLPFYMHKTGHWLGLDVHDVGDYQLDHEWRQLEPGMVFTVEPGIYIAEASAVDEQWHNIGIRIEDNVLIRKHGCEVLTAAVPKEIKEIEALMAA